MTTTPAAPPAKRKLIPARVGAFEVSAQLVVPRLFELVGDAIEADGDYFLHGLIP